MSGGTQTKAKALAQSQGTGPDRTGRLIVRRDGTEKIILEINADVPCRLESAENLNGESWQPVESSPSVLENGTLQWRMFISQQGSARFYRVVSALQ